MINKDQRKIIVLGLLLFSLIMIISSANAASITINSASNFKSTIQNAPTNSIIELNSNTGEFKLNSNNVNIIINKTITIKNSNSLKNTIINLQENGRAFDIKKGGHLTLINVTIKNGYIGGDGGAIYNEGTISLSGCTFTNNKAVFGSGGSICIRLGVANLTNCIFTNNKAYSGAAVFNKGNDTTLSECTFTSNFLTVPYYYGEDEDDDKPLIRSSEGSIYNGKDSILFVQSTNIKDIFSNVDNDGFVKITIKSSDNFKSIIENLPANYIILLDSSLGDFNLDSKNVNIIIDKNIIIQSFDLAQYVTINLNKYGRAFNVLSGGNLILVNIIIKNGYANNGAVIYNDGGTVNINNCIFTNNLATNEGGVIYNNRGIITLCYSVFLGNLANNEGGAIYNDGGATLNYCTFIANTAIMGGALFNVDCPIMGSYFCSVSHSNFVNNSATKKGGAIYNNFADSTSVIDSTFSGNKAPEGPDIFNPVSGMDNNLHNVNILIITNVLDNKLKITVIATDKDSGKEIIDETVYLYVNGKVIGSKKTDIDGMAIFIYDISKSGKHTINVKINGFTKLISNCKYIYLEAAATKDTIVSLAKVKLYKVTTSKATNKKTKKIHTKIYKYKNLGHITGSKTFTIKLGKNYKLIGKVIKSSNVIYKYNKKTKELTVTVKKLAYNNIAQIKFETQHV
ncbi:MAG: hypothetical protein FWE58_02375 [Methanobrevibacter sp.]|nr:hypothetical protein [Methanobrevibacter sp.]